MTEPSSSPSPDRMEAFLSGAFKRIQRSAIVLSLVATAAATLFSGWRSGLALALGAFVAYLNFVWLHRSSEAMVQRMLAPAENKPSKLKSVFSFIARYVFVIAFAYVIFRSYPQVRVAVMVGLVCPILATMGESIYEAVVISKTDETPD